MTHSEKSKSLFAPVEDLPKVLAAAFMAAGVLGSASQADAAQTFRRQILLPSNGEVFDLVIETEDSPITITQPLFTAPSSCQPSTSIDCSGVTVGGPQLQSPGYTFTGFKITKITGFATEGGTVYDILGPGLASNSGVFNYPDPIDPPDPLAPGNPGPAVKPDSIPHSLPDFLPGAMGPMPTQLFNPGGYGFDPAGFTIGAPPAFTGFPSSSLDNLFSFGGITFDIGKFAVPGDESSFVFEEPYQLFTVPYDSTSTTTGETPKAGDYAGCPGSCKGAVVSAPAPLPILGVAAAFGSLRKLRNFSSLLKKNHST
jgi:hypothetical protein